jgi:hypothetical protein
MMKRVEIDAPPKKKRKLAKCPSCGGPATDVRSKTTRLGIVNDEKVLVTDKKWNHRGIICFGTCGFFTPEKIVRLTNPQVEMDWDSEDD